MAVGTAVYAQVLVDIPARELGDKLFTYRVPDYLMKETFIGAQVLVPFGNQDVVGGYVVSLADAFSGAFTPKEIAEVVDTDPLFDGEYIDFLYFVAEYYCSSLSAVIAAAVPADFSPRLKRIVELKSPEMADPETTRSATEKDPGSQRILDVLRASARFAMSFRTLRQRTKMTQAKFYRSLSTLRQAGIVEIRAESVNAMTAKTVAFVSWTGEKATTARQESIVEVLRQGGGPMPMARLIETVGTTYATIHKMSAQGIVSISQEEVLRDPMAAVGEDAVLRALPALTEDQDSVLTILSSHLQSRLESAPGKPAEAVKPWLLFGVTGSGKTEVYLRLIQQAIDLNRTAVLLVPEISLTPQLAQRLKSRFGKRVAVWHSALSAGERYDTWRRLRKGDVKVLLGARSAILASMPDLGLVILDEEHDGSYKQSSPNPRYHARHLAIEKAGRTGAVVVLGSATPDVGSYRQARLDGRLLELPERVFKQAMPTVSIVDMRQEFHDGNRSIFSTSLRLSMEAALGRSEQIILLMNRRGYANHVFCRACGHVVRCKSCSVAMVFHQPLSAKGGAAYLSCHHCGLRTGATTTCPSCQSPFLKQYGLGTQRVVEEVETRFPDARTLRLDSDVTARKGAFEEIFHKFARGDADILIGTQMVSKGLDIPNVTLVGVLAADAAFNLPDYRSLERGFQLLTQVSGRAGRGDRPGKVILQTYNPELPVLNSARSHDYARFVAEELTAREELEYPPFSQIIRLVVAGPEEADVQAACEELAEELTSFLDDQVAPEALRVLGPAPCLIERIRGKFRHHLIVKNLAGDTGRLLVAAFLRRQRLSAGLTLTVDVDAYDLI